MHNPARYLYDVEIKGLWQTNHQSCFSVNFMVEKEHCLDFIIIYQSEINYGIYTT